MRRASIDSLDFSDQEEESNEDLHIDDDAVVTLFGKTPKSFRLYVRMLEEDIESYEVFKRQMTFF